MREAGSAQCTTCSALLHNVCILANCRQDHARHDKQKARELLVAPVLETASATCLHNQRGVTLLAEGAACKAGNIHRFSIRPEATIVQFQARVRTGSTPCSSLQVQGSC